MLHSEHEGLSISGSVSWKFGCDEANEQQGPSIWSHLLASTVMLRPASRKWKEGASPTDIQQRSFVIITLPTQRGDLGKHFMQEPWHPTLPCEQIVARLLISSTLRGSQGQKDYFISLRLGELYIQVPFPFGKVR